MQPPDISESDTMTTRTFPGNYQSLEAISNFIIDQAEQENFTKNDIYAIQTAVDEACSNIIDHAYRGENKGLINIQVQPIEKGLQIIIQDDGIPFDPDDVPEPDITSPLEIRKERGLGIFFMRKLMDRVIFDFSESAGNTLTLVKFREG